MSIGNGFVDLSTGEWTPFAPKDDKNVKLVIKDYIGTDVKFPKDCTDQTELKETLKNLDASVHFKTRVDTEYLLDSVVGGHIKPSGAEAVKWMCKRVCAWNYVFITKKEILDSGLTDKAHYSRWLKELSNYFKVESVGNGVDTLRVTINPVVAWKGHEMFRQAAIRKYYGFKSDDF